MCNPVWHLSGFLLFRTTGGFYLHDQLLSNIQNSVSQIIHAKLPTFLSFVVYKLLKEDQKWITELQNLNKDKPAVC